MFQVSGRLVLGSSNESDGGNLAIQDGALYFLDSNGHAVFDLGGIYSQTVASYLSTGAAGGLTKDSIEENVFAYKIVTYNKNSNAKTKIFRKMGGAGKAASLKEVETFYAYSTSTMGLLGITLGVYVRGIPRFAIAGYEVTTKLKEGCEVDLFGNGYNSDSSLKEYSFHYKKAGKHFTTMSGKKWDLKYI